MVYAAILYHQTLPFKLAMETPSLSLSIGVALVHIN